MHCPNCKNELAVLAKACPHCGQPGLGSLVGKSIFTPEQEARQLEVMGSVVVTLLVCVGVLVVLGVIAYALMGIGEAVSQIPFGSIFGSIGNALALVFKWVGIAALICMPFGLMGGFLANTSGNGFGQGYWWGQLLGPVGLIVVVFQPSQERDSRPNRKIRENRGYDYNESESVENVPEEVQSISYSCVSCGKKYKLSLNSLGQTFLCVKCKAINMVSASMPGDTGSKGEPGVHEY